MQSLAEHGVHLAEPNKTVFGAVPAPAENSPTPIPAPVGVPQRPKLSGRVLVVEDTPENQRLLCLQLKKIGVDRELAENGLIGFERALTAWKASSPFDLILMDMQMPVMDGYEATRRLRSEGYPGLIVALTANALKGDREKCLQAGCDDYASKPIDAAGLAALVGRFLS